MHRESAKFLDCVMYFLEEIVGKSIRVEFLLNFLLTNRQKLVKKMEV